MGDADLEIKLSASPIFVIIFIVEVSENKYSHNKG